MTFNKLCAIEDDINDFRLATFIDTFYLLFRIYLFTQ
jgi:hypothetical protein